MCWSIGITAFFSTIYIISIYVYILWKPKNYVQKILFSCFFLVMELYQLSQWLFGDVINYSTGKQNKCSIINKNFTYFGFILIWLQPILFNVLGHITYRSKEIFKKMYFVNVPLFVIAVISIFIITEFKINSGYSRTDASYGFTTCTFIGKNHHLAWMFAGAHPDYQANHLLYFILCVIPFMFYERDLIQYTY